MRYRYSICCAIAFFFMLSALSQTTLTGSWRFVSYRNVPTNQFKTQNYSSYRYGSIMLNLKDSLGIGTFEGHTISNTIKGEYQIIDDKTVLFSSVTKSLFDETNEIMDIRKGLQGSTTFEVGENNLKIIYNNGQDEMNFVRVSYDFKGTWKIKQITDRLENNPNKTYNEMTRFHFEEGKIIIFNATNKKNTLEKQIIQTFLFHKFSVEEIKKSELEKKGIEPIVLDLFMEGLKYEIFSNQMFWYSERFKVELIPAEP